MEKYLKKVMGIIWSPLFIFPFIFILVKNYFAFVENEDLTIDSPIIVIKSDFIKFLLICIDCLIIYTFYTFLKVKLKKEKKVIIEEEQVKNELHLLHWYDKLKNDADYKSIRFKKLNVGYPKFTFPQHLLDEVELNDFILSEQNRISLFIGSQMGLYPKIEEVFNEVTESKTIAVLSKSLMSGAVSGLKIYSVSKGQMIELADFKN